MKAFLKILNFFKNQRNKFKVLLIFISVLFVLLIVLLVILIHILKLSEINGVASGSINDIINLIIIVVILLVVMHFFYYKDLVVTPLRLIKSLNVKEERHK